MVKLLLVHISCQLAFFLPHKLHQGCVGPTWDPPTNKIHHIVKKGLERNAPFIFNHVMHCDLKQELGQVLGGEVDNWPSLIWLEAFSLWWLTQIGHFPPKKS